MFKSVKMTAEEQFAASQKKATKARAEKELVQEEEAQHIAKLRALRLAKEAADKKVATLAAAEKLAAKKKKVSRLATAN